MTKFKRFLDKYGVLLTHDNCRGHYGNYAKWRSGRIKDPGIQSLNKFYNIFKNEIEFDEKGLMDCFKIENDSFYYEKPFILGIEGGLHRRYSYLFTNYLLNNRKPNSKILVLDQAKYNHTYDALGKPYEKGLELFELTTIKENEDRILQTMYNSIDYCDFSIYESFQSSPKTVKKTAIKLLEDLKSLKRYDLIIINYQEGSSIKIICEIIRQVVDQLYFVGVNNEYEKNYSYLREQTTNLEILTSQLNYRQEFIVKENEQNKFIDYWLMSCKITGESLLKTEEYVPMLDPRVFEDLKMLYRKFTESSKYKSFREEDNFSMIRNKCIQ